MCRASKGDLFRRLVTIRVSAAGPDAQMCPVVAMAEHFAATNHIVQTEPLFRHGDGSYITRGTESTLRVNLYDQAFGAAIGLRHVQNKPD